MTQQEKEKERSDPRYFAGFICAIGYSFLFIALYSLFWNGSDVANTNTALAYGSLTLIFLVVCALFGIVNFELRWPYYKPYFVATLLLCTALAVYLIHAVDSTSSAEKTLSAARQFAIAVPVGTEGNLKTATLFWSLPESEASPDDGLVKMILGAILTIAFGVIYPFIARGGRSEETGFVQKLVVPILGAILFGVGASEQVQAEERKQDIRLVSQGIPPIVSISKGKREGLVLSESEISLATRRRLQASVDTLISKIGDIPKGENTPIDVRIDGMANLSTQDRRAILANLEGIREDFRLGSRQSQLASRVQADLLRERLRKEFQDNRSEIVALGERIDFGAENVASKINNMTDDNKAATCTLLGMHLNAAFGGRDDLIAVLRRSDEKNARHILQSLWVGLKGEDTKRQEEELAELLSSQDPRADLEQISRVCGYKSIPSSQTTANDGVD